MPRKMNTALAFLAFFTLCSDAYIVQRNHGYEFPMKKVQYTCPPYSKWVSPKIASSSVQARIISRNGDETKRTKQEFTFTPVSARLFNMLDMVALPSREVCVLGGKLKSYILPENTQFQSMLSIAVWCLPCLLEKIHTKRNHCLKQQLNSIGEDDNTKFKRFSERFVAAVNKYYYYNNFLTFFA